MPRDAANGIQLWRHELPSWGGAQGGKKVGPAQMHRHLVADETRVYATLGEFAPVTVLDAATGEPIRTLEPTARAEEIILSAGILVALVNPNTEADVRRGHGKRKLRVVALEADSGKLLWQHAREMVMPMTLAADAAQVVFHDGKAIESLDLRSGEPRWTSPPTGQKIDYWDKANPDSPGAEKSTIVLAPQFAPTLVIYNGVVAFAGGRQLNVVSAADGERALAVGIRAVELLGARRPFRIRRLPLGARSEDEPLASPGRQSRLQRLRSANGRTGKERIGPLRLPLSARTIAATR